MDMSRSSREAPASPGSLEPGSMERPRPRSRGISFLSGKSEVSEGGTRYHESPQEKAKRDSLWKGGSKSNPNSAIQETQPGEANLWEKSTLQNISEMQHKDTYGNVIVDPDRSNPTRPRLERPLDTIRSFEKAIDDGYSRRHSYMRQDAESWDAKNQYASRRSSYFGGSEVGPTANRYGMQQQGGGYYGSQNGHNGPPRPARYANNRGQSEPQLYGGQRPYGHHGYHQSYDTVNTGYTNGSDSTGQWANSTDPSSENSSIDRMPNKPGTPGYDSYGQNGYNGPIMEEQNPNSYGEYPQQNMYGQYNGYGPQDGYGVGQGDYAQRDGYGNPDGYGMHEAYGRNNSAGAVQPPANVASGSGRRPIKLNSNGSSGGYDGAYGNGGPPPASRPQPAEKRKSWLKRRFSKG